jgi:pyruvate/2-oxoglutarate dehydrogenase complex dihydrolipoamide dehydrogenase (E3) component
MSDAIPHELDQLLLANTAPADWQPPAGEGRYNLVVIGGGPAGLVCASAAAGLGARVALIEKHRLGGDCLHYGCVPSKALLACGRVAAVVRRAGEFGVRLGGEVTVDFPAVMNRMRQLRAGISRHDAAERFRKLGVDVFFGQPRFSGPEAVALVGRTLRFARAVIATGARPATIPVPGLEQAGYLTNETVFDLTRLPGRLVVVGAGPIGCELAQAFARFGSQVHLVDVLPRVLPRDDPDAAELIRRRLGREGVEMHLGVRVTAVEHADGAKVLLIDKGGETVRLAADDILLAVGRKANVENLDLEAAGVRYGPAGIEVNDFLQTSNPNIYAAGDVCSPYKFTHAADALGRIVVQNALFFGRRRASKLVIPWCTYTDPEVAHVGLTAEEAAKQGLPIQTHRVELAAVDRAVLDGETDGFAVVHSRRGRIVGATLVAAHAGDMIAEVVLAMTHQHKLTALAGTVHPYPTQAEVFPKLGDAYQRDRLTPLVGSLLRRLLAWRR